MERYKNMKLRKRCNTKMLKNLVFFVLLIAFTFWFIFRNQDLNELLNVLKSADKKYILFAAFLMFCTYLVESINIRSILIHLGEKKFSIFRAFRYTAIGAFFSAITPAASGGQPVEIYYMSKDGIKVYNGTMALLIQICAFQICTIFLSLVCGIININLLKDGMIWFYILGIVLNGTVLIIMLLSIFSNKTIKKLLNVLLKGMKKAKVKNYEIKKKKLEESIEEYSKSSDYIKNNKMEFIKAIGIVLIQVIIFHSIPYFIYRSFGLSGMSYLKLFSMQAILFTTVSSIPLPGSIGVSETLFLKLYGVAFGTALLSGAMLLYRFVSFYFYICLFLVIVVITASKTKKVESEIDKNVKEIEKDYNIKSSKKLSYS